MTTLYDAFEVELTQKDEGYKGRSEDFCITTPLQRALRVYHVSTGDDFFFNPANFIWSPTPPDHHAELSPCRHWCHNLTCHCLMFNSSNDESPERPSEWCSPPPSADARSPISREADVSSSVPQITPTTDPFLTEAWDDVNSWFGEHFPTVPLDDDIWAEEQIQDRCLCIQERPNH